FQFATDANGQPILAPQTDPFLPPQIGSDDQADVSNELNLLGLVPRPDAFFTYRELGTRIKGNSYNLDGTVADPARPIITTPGPGFLQEDTSADALREYAGIDLAYWNDFRNVEYHVRKTGQNVPNPLDTTAAATLEPDNYIRTGSPLDPRLPESINIRFTLFLQAPSVGSPD